MERSIRPRRPKTAPADSPSTWSVSSAQRQKVLCLKPIGAYFCLCSKSSGFFAWSRWLQSGPLSLFTRASRAPTRYCTWQWRATMCSTGRCHPPPTLPHILSRPSSAQETETCDGYLSTALNGDVSARYDLRDGDRSSYLLVQDSVTVGKWPGHFLPAARLQMAEYPPIHKPHTRPAGVYLGHSHSACARPPVGSALWGQSCPPPPTIKTAQQVRPSVANSQRLVYQVRGGREASR